MDVEQKREAVINYLVGREARADNLVDEFLAGRDDIRAALNADQARQLYNDLQALAGHPFRTFAYGGAAPAVNMKVRPFLDEFAQTMLDLESVSRSYQRYNIPPHSILDTHRLDDWGKIQRARVAFLLPAVYGFDSIKRWALTDTSAAMRGSLRARTTLTYINGLGEPQLDYLLCFVTDLAVRA